ncbi:Abi family protein [Lacticaseibacillus salsurivasis]|uniref:Abi family protein n=1 Tax=Lacticaseibacillus salsurivasis TaxID=3081441 RepID=UPI0030C731A0
MSDKPFKTIDELITLLNDKRHLTFLSEETAKSNLQRYGYYEIINSYKDNFMVDPSDDDAGFKPGSTFEHIFELFLLDRKISDAVLSGLADFEITLKQAVAYVVSENIGFEQAIYTNPDIYEIGEPHKKKKKNGQPLMDRDILESNFYNTINSKEEPFCHYHSKVGNVPPWIMVKNFSLGSTIYWYRLLPKEIRLKIQSLLIGLDEDVLIASDKSLLISQGLGDMMSLCLEYRNLCAHGGRVYNHRNKWKQLTYTPFLYQNPNARIQVSKNQYSNGALTSSIGALILALRRLDNLNAFKSICSWIDVRLADYFKKFPEDRDYLMDSMEIRGTSIETLLDATQ